MNEHDNFNKKVSLLNTIDQRDAMTLLKNLDQIQLVHILEKIDSNIVTAFLVSMNIETAVTIFNNMNLETAALILDEKVSDIIYISNLLTIIDLKRGINILTAILKSKKVVDNLLEMKKKRRIAILNEMNEETIGHWLSYVDTKQGIDILAKINIKKAASILLYRVYLDKARTF